MAIAALILGVIGVLSFWAIGFGALPGIIAIILGVIGMNRAKESGIGGGQAKAGLALGIVAVIASIVFFVFLVSRADDIDFDGGINTDRPDGICNHDRFLQDPDC
jgi:hypothetical protein